MNKNEQKIKQAEKDLKHSRELIENLYRKIDVEKAKCSGLEMQIIQDKYDLGQLKASPLCSTDCCGYYIPCGVT